MRAAYRPGMARTLDLDGALSARARALLHGTGRGSGPLPGWVPSPPQATVGAAGAPVEGVAAAVRSWAVAWPDPREKRSRATATVSEPVEGDPAAGSSARRPVGRHRAPSPSMVTIPGSLTGARLRARGSAVLAVLGVALVAGVVFALRVTAATRAAEPVPLAPSRTGLVARSVPVAFASGSGSGLGSTGPPTGDAGATARLVVIHVVGDVADPGVVRVPEGSRVVDVIAAAGGALASADLERINLARVVVDGEQVHVPAPGEQLLPNTNGSGGGGAVGQGSGTGPIAAGPVNLNTADLAQLDTLPGVGPVLAQRILDWRSAHGRFSSVDELGEVSGIGEKLLAQLTPKVTV